MAFRKFLTVILLSTSFCVPTSDILATSIDPETQEDSCADLRQQVENTEAMLEFQKEQLEKAQKWRRGLKKQITKIEKILERGIDPRTGEPLNEEERQSLEARLQTLKNKLNKANEEIATALENIQILTETLEDLRHRLSECLKALDRFASIMP